MYMLNNRRELLIVASLFLLTAIFMSRESRAGVDCYTFSNFDTSTVYHVGDSFNFEAHHGQVFALRTLSGEPINPADPNAQFLQAGNAAITGSASGAPEMHQYLTALRITPSVPATKVWFDYAQNTGYSNTALLANIGANGDELQLGNGMANLSSVVLGNNNRGQVEVTSTMVLPVNEPAHWITGHVEFTALSGAIDYVAFGGLQAKFDDLCIETP